MKGTSFSFWVDTPEAHLQVRPAMQAATDAFQNGQLGIVIAQVSQAPGMSVHVKGAFIAHEYAVRIQEIINEYSATIHRESQKDHGE